MSYRIVGDSHNQTGSVPHENNGDTLMLDMEIIYPDGVSTSAEERAFDSFLLSYITEQALKQKSPKVQLMPDEVMKAWEEHKTTPQH